MKRWEGPESSPSPACLPAAWGAGLLCRGMETAAGGLSPGGREEEQKLGLSLMDKPPPAKNCGATAPSAEEAGGAVCHWLGSKGDLGAGVPVTERPECLVMCCNLPSCSLLSLFFFSVWDFLIPVSSLLFYLRMCHPFPVLHCHLSSCLFPSVCSLNKLLHLPFSILAPASP